MSDAIQYEYFKNDHGATWRFDGLKLEGRFNGSWFPSVFHDPTDLKKCLNGIAEVWEDE